MVVYVNDIFFEWHKNENPGFCFCCKPKHTPVTTFCFALILSDRFNMAYSNYTIGWKPVKTYVRYKKEKFKTYSDTIIDLNG